MKRNTTADDRQLKAIELLCAGLPIGEVADQVGVDRVTLWRWRTDDAVFVAAYNQRRQDIHADYADKLRSLSDKALMVIEAQLDQGDVAAARFVLRALGLDALGPPQGSTVADDIEEEWRNSVFLKGLMRMG